MSWSTQSPQEVTSASSDAEILPNPPFVDDSGTLDQVEVAREVAKTIMASGAVGGEEARFRVTASGHSNPDHVPREGWANDMINLTVSQTRIAEGAPHATD